MIDSDIIAATQRQLAPMCHWYIISREQRQAEMHRLLGTNGTEQFKKMGCYSCDSYESQCKAYEPIGE